MNTELKIEHVEVKKLHSHPSNPRVHSKKQIEQIAQSIEAFGFRMPVIIDQDSRLISGHARVEACKLLKMNKIPAVRVTDLDDTQIRGLMIADNQLTLVSSWDDQLLGEHLKVLSDLDLDFDIECLGFDYGEIEQRVLSIEGFDEPVDESGSDEQPEPDSQFIITQSGDLWTLGSHRILCADSTKPGSYQRLLGQQRASMIFTDPPYNISAKTIGQVCANEHGDFAMAAGEMSTEQFTGFLG